MSISNFCYLFSCENAIFRGFLCASVSSSKPISHFPCWVQLVVAIARLLFVAALVEANVMSVLSLLSGAVVAVDLTQNKGFPPGLVVLNLLIPAIHSTFSIFFVKNDF